MDDQHKAWKQERNEKPLFAKEADILQHGQQYDGDYLSVVVSLLYFFFAVVCWGSSIKAGKSNTLNKLTRKAGSVILEPIEPK